MQELLLGVVGAIMLNIGVLGGVALGWFARKRFGERPPEAPELSAREKKRLEDLLKHRQDREAEYNRMNAYSIEQAYGIKSEEGDFDGI